MWSKVIAGVILTVLAAIWVHFGSVGAILSATVSIPVWLLLTCLLCATMSVVLYRRHQNKKRAAAEKKAREGAQSFEQIARQLDRERKSARSTPELSITFSSPQGGMHIVPPPYSSEIEWLGGWFHVAAMVANTDDASRSACDLVISLEFTSESDQATARRVERALFKDAALTFPNKRCCLEAGQSTEIILAVWSDHDSVQTIRAWSSAKAPLGEELFPGIWWCRITVQAQGIERSERFRLKIGKRTVSRQMLPPGSPGDPG